MNTSHTIPLSRFFAGLWLFALLGLSLQASAAAAPDPRMFGPWAVQQASSQENVGLRVYFSPDGNFFLVDPRTQLGMTGNWSIGRSGLLVSIYGNGQWAKLWDANIAFQGNDQMLVDVVESQISPPQQFGLVRTKY